MRTGHYYPWHGTGSQVPPGPGIYPEVVVLAVAAMSGAERCQGVGYRLRWNKPAG